MTPQEINKRIAEFMGECYHDDIHYEDREDVCVDSRTITPYIYEKCKKCGAEYPRNKNYAENISDAWMVKTEMNKRGYRLFYSEYTDGLYVCFVPREKEFENTPFQVSQFDFESAPKAICLAALATMEGK